MSFVLRYMGDSVAERLQHKRFTAVVCCRKEIRIGESSGRKKLLTVIEFEGVDTRSGEVVRESFWALDLNKVKEGKRLLNRLYYPWMQKSFVRTIGAQMGDNVSIFYEDKGEGVSQAPNACEDGTKRGTERYSTILLRDY